MKKNNKKYRIEYSDERNGPTFIWKEGFDDISLAMGKRDVLLKKGKFNVVVKNNQI